MGNALTNSPIFGGGLDYVTRIWKIERDPFICTRLPSGEEVPEKVREQEKRDLIWCKSMALGLGKVVNTEETSIDTKNVTKEGGSENESTNTENEGSCESLKINSEIKLHHWIVLRHFESGRVLLYVDGYLRAEGHASFNGTMLKVNLSPTKMIVVRISFNESQSFSYKYECKLNAASNSPVIVPESSQVLEQGHDPKHMIARVEESVVLSGADAEKYNYNKTTLPQNNPLPKKPEEPVVMYQVKTSLYVEGSMGKGEPIQTVVVLRRFSDFVRMYNGLLSAFCGTHLYSNVPPLPPKHNKYFSDHLDPLFIHKRKESLDHFLSKVLKLPRAARNPDVRIFLGLTQEFEGTKINRITHVAATTNAGKMKKYKEGASTLIFQSGGEDDAGNKEDADSNNQNSNTQNSIYQNNEENGSSFQNSNTQNSVYQNNEENGSSFGTEGDMI